MISGFFPFFINLDDFVDVCEAGFTAGEGTGCEPCGEDTYKSEEGRQECTQCDENTSTEGATGSTQQDQCLGKIGSCLDRLSACSLFSSR